MYTEIRLIMSSDDDMDDISMDEYIKNYDMNLLVNDENIQEILEDNFKSNFTSKCRCEIEIIKQKYINLYSFNGIFARDKNNVNWERLFDIIYNNIEKDYDLGIVTSNPEHFIDILENKHLK